MRTHTGDGGRSQFGKTTGRKTAVDLGGSRALAERSINSVDNSFRSRNFPKRLVPGRRHWNGRDACSRWEGTDARKQFVETFRQYSRHGQTHRRGTGRRLLSALIADLPRALGSPAHLNVRGTLQFPGDPHRPARLYAVACTRRISVAANTPPFQAVSPFGRVCRPHSHQLWARFRYRFGTVR